jgi:hypothetical protein
MNKFQRWLRSGQKPGATISQGLPAIRGEKPKPSSPALKDNAKPAKIKDY